MNSCVVSQKAHQDIRELYEFGSQKFGKDQALRYVEELNLYFQLLSQNPYLGRERSEIRKGLFSFPYTSHILFYRIFKNHIRIVRVLHGSRDLNKYYK